MKYTLYTLAFAAFSLGACSSETSKPFSEEETQEQDSVDQLNQDAAFDALLNDSTNNQNDTIIK